MGRSWAKAVPAAPTSRRTANLRSRKSCITSSTWPLTGYGASPVAVCLGLAGVDRDGDGEVIRGIMRRLGFRERTLIVNDALIALVAGVPLGQGDDTVGQGWC